MSMSKKLRSLGFQPAKLLILGRLEAYPTADYWFSDRLPTIDHSPSRLPFAPEDVVNNAELLTNLFGLGSKAFGVLGVAFGRTQVWDVFLPE